MKLVIDYKPTDQPKLPILPVDIARELNRIIDHDFFGYDHDSVYSTSTSSNTEHHNKLIGLLMVMNVKPELTDTYYTAIRDHAARPFMVRKKGNWEPLYNILRGMPQITDVNISTE